MVDALICEPLRTPVGRFGGMFRDVAVTELATTVISEVLSRTGVPPDAVDDVILGQGYANGEAPALGRVAALDAGMPVDVPGVQVDRRCGSGLQAVLDAAMQVQTGVADVVIAGGAEVDEPDRAVLDRAAVGRAVGRGDARGTEGSSAAGSPPGGPTTPSPVG